MTDVASVKLVLQILGSGNRLSIDSANDVAYFDHTVGTAVLRNGGNDKAVNRRGVLNAAKDEFFAFRNMIRYGNRTPHR